MYARLGNQTKQNAKLQENYKETIQKNLRSQLQHQNTVTIYAAAKERTMKIQRQSLLAVLEGM